MRRGHYSFPFVALAVVVILKDLTWREYRSPTPLIHLICKVGWFELFSTECVYSEEEWLDVDWFVKNDTCFFWINISEGIAGYRDPIWHLFTSLWWIEAKVMLGAYRRRALRQWRSTLPWVTIKGEGIFECVHVVLDLKEKFRACLTSTLVPAASW